MDEITDMIYFEQRLVDQAQMMITATEDSSLPEVSTSYKPKINQEMTEEITTPIQDHSEAPVSEVSEIQPNKLNGHAKEITDQAVPFISKHFNCLTGFKDSSF